MTMLTPGQNAPLSGDATEVSVRIAGNVVVDVSAYLLDVNGKVRGDGDMVFYGQRTDASGAVSIADDASRGSLISVALARVPQVVERIAICAAVDASASPNGTLVQASPVEVDAGGMRFVPQFERPDISAATLVELYRRNGAWKVRASGQGFSGGLAPLSRMYGIEIADEAPARAQTPAAPPAPSAAPATRVPQVPTPAAVPISLSKISLTKERPSISLKKQGGAFGTVAINLNWNRGEKTKKGFFGGLKSGAIDLDLGCLFELADGQKGVVQALGNSFGSLDRPPFIRLAGDDRSGDAADGEWLHIAGDHWAKIRRVVVYAFIYEGVPNWASTDGVVSITMQGQPPVEVRLDETSGKGMCAVALLENSGGDLRVNREIRYFKGHRDLDEAFGWGMRWSAGSK